MYVSIQIRGHIGGSSVPSIIELCKKVETERAAIQAIGQATSAEDVFSICKSLLSATAWAISKTGRENQDWAEREQHFYYLIVEIFGASDETALALSKKMVELLKQFG
jgi:hypothetical protein